MKKRYFFEMNFLTFLAISLSLGLIVSLSFSFVSSKYLEEEIYSDIDRVLLEKSQMIDEFILNEEQKYFEIYDEEMFIDFLKEERNTQEYYSKKEKILNYFLNFSEVSLGIIDSAGEFLLDTEPNLVGFNINTYPESVRYLNRSYDELNYRILPHPMEDKYDLLIPKKIFDSDNNFVGIFSYRIEDDRLRNLFLDVNSFSPSLEGYLINQDFVLITPSKHIAGPDKGVVLQNVFTNISKDCFKSISENKYENDFVFGDGRLYESYWGGEVYGNYVGMNKFNWCLFVEYEKEDLSFLGFLLSSFSMILFFSILIICLFFYFVKINK